VLVNREPNKSPATQTSIPKQQRVTADAWKVASRKSGKTRLASDAEAGIGLSPTKIAAAAARRTAGAG